jgi:hypothetical protein
LSAIAAAATAEAFGDGRLRTITRFSDHVWSLEDIVNLISYYLTMKTSIPFLWVLPFWGGVGAAYFIAAYCYLWRKTGVKMWKVWWQTNASNLKTERRFAEEIRRFPRWNFAYQMVKWGTLSVAIGYLIFVLIYVSHLNPN